MKVCLSGALTLTIVLTNAAATIADPITITVDRRSTFAGANSERTFARAADTLVATASAPGGVSAATLASSYSNPMHWFGAGAFNISAAVPGVYGAASNFSVDFTVTSPLSYTFDSSFTGSSSFPFANRTALLDMDTGRVDDDGDIIFNRVFIFTDEVPRTGNTVNPSFTGLLVPGSYVFAVFSGRDGFGPEAGTAASSFSFTFDLTPADTAPVPEPASLLLLGTGLAGMFGYRRRAANRRQI